MSFLPTIVPPMCKISVKYHVLGDAHFPKLKQYFVTEIPDCYICPDDLAKRANDTGMSAGQILANKLPDHGGFNKK